MKHVKNPSSRRTKAPIAKSKPSPRRKALAAVVAASRLPARSTRQPPLASGRKREELPPAAGEGLGKYVYCVIQSAEPLKFGAVGIGEAGSEIHTVHYRDLAAVVSD